MNDMKTWEADVIYVGKIRTRAKSEAKAVQNIRWRLWNEHGWTRFNAMRHDIEIKEIPPCENI